MPDTHKIVTISRFLFRTIGVLQLFHDTKPANKNLKLRQQKLNRLRTKPQTNSSNNINPKHQIRQAIVENLKRR
jgi:hypothetical protein